MKRIIATFLLMSLPICVLWGYISSKGLGDEIVYQAKESDEIVSQEITDRLTSVEELEKEKPIELKVISHNDTVFGENKEGSAISIQGTTGIVTFYATDEVTTWNKTDIIETQTRLSIACDYLKEQTANYGWSSEFIINKSDLMYYESFSTTLSNLTPNEIYDEIENWINTDANSEYLISKYNLDNIVYLVVLNAPGISYATPHYVEDEEQNYYECVFLYLFDENTPDKYETPAAFAHEILHLFGAIDLYDGNNNTISDELIDYIEENYRNDIMYTTFEKGYISNQNLITNEITDITAYELGLIEYIDEIEDFPELIKNDKWCQYKNKEDIVAE